MSEGLSGTRETYRADAGARASRLDDVPRPPVDPQSAGLLAAWTVAVVARQASLGQAVAAVEAGTDGHVVQGLAGADGGGSEVALVTALGTLLERRPAGVRVAFPQPGDPLGLHGAGAFTSSALVAQSAVVVEGAAPFGLVPEPDLRGSSYRGVRWRVFALDDVTSPPLTVDPSRVVEQADRALRRALRAATEALEGVDLARWRPEAATGGHEAGAALRSRPLALPPNWPPAARALAERAVSLWRMLDVATADDGAASVSAAAVKSVALRDLSHAVREAAMVAFNVPASALLARPA